MADLKKTLTATDKSTKTLLTAIGSLTKVAAELKALEGTVPEMLQEIDFKQADLDQIDEQTKEKVRRAKTELDLQVLENEDKVLERLMKERGYAVITSTALTEQEQALIAAKQANEAEVAKAVSTAESALHMRYKGELSTLKAEHGVAVAQKDADLKAKDMQIKFQQETIDRLNKTIEDERQARIDIANAEANRQGVIVNTTSK